MIRLWLLALFCLDVFYPKVVKAFVPSQRKQCAGRRPARTVGLSSDQCPEGRADEVSDIFKSLDNAEPTVFTSRRSFLIQSSVLLGTVSSFLAEPSRAADTGSSATAEVTDRIYLDLRGLDGPTSTESRRVVIGLFGKEAPKATSMLKQLVSSKGLPVPCKPKDEGRMLQKDQLTANKVYNSCKENEDKGVNYEYGTVWRIVKDQRIDVGSVSGKFVAREFPEWTGSNSLLHDSAGVVSVRKGSTSGFGFTIYPGGKNGEAAKDLDEQHLVVGRILEGMDVIKSLNEIPVVTSSKVNYMGLTGGPSVSTAPSRGCFYGGPMYCNENKPLQKVSIYATGSL